VISTLGIAAAMTGLNAAVAEGVSERQRGTASAAMFAPQAPGLLVGLVVLPLVGGPPAVGYLALAVVAGLCATPFLRAHRDALTTDAEPTALGPDDHGSSRRDFSWALSGRLLVNLANALATCYLLFFLTDALQASNPQLSLAEMTGVYLAAVVSATWFGAQVSDRSGRRRGFAVVGAGLQAGGTLLLVLDPRMETAFVAAVLLGLGYGAFLAVDQAVIAKVLPSAASCAKDLGTINIGFWVPQAGGPALASVVVGSLGGYTALFAIAAVTSLAAALCIGRISVID
jgi:hypothetical protein